jgi:hypothetical protein
MGLRNIAFSDERSSTPNISSKMLLGLLCLSAKMSVKLETLLTSYSPFD